MTAETETNHAKALALRDELIDVYANIDLLKTANRNRFSREKFALDGKGIEDLEARERELLIDILSLRKDGVLPYGVNVYVGFHQAEGEPHDFSANTFLIEIATDGKTRKPLTIKGKINRLRRPGKVEDSLDALSLMVPYEDTEISDSSFVYRSTAEINAIFTVFSNERDEDAKTELKKLKDRLIMERFIEGLVEGTYKDSSIEIQIVHNGEGVRVFVFEKGKPIGRYLIPGPESANFSTARNRKLAELLEKLEKMPKIRRVDPLIPES